MVPSAEPGVVVTVPMAGTTDTTAPPATTAEAGAPMGNAWTMMGYDVGSTYHNSNETTLTKENAASLQVAWRADMGTNVYGAPLQVNGNIYLAVAGRSVGQERTTAFNAESGEVLWSNDEVGSTGSMAYDDGRLYVHMVSSKLVALDASTGQKVWETAAGPGKTDGASSPIIYGDRIYLGGSDGELSSGNMFRGYVAAFDKATGAEGAVGYTVTGNARGANIWSTVALDPGANLVIATTGNNHGQPATDTSDAFVAFDMDQLEIQWKNQRLANDTWSLTSLAAPDADFGANPTLYEAELNGAMVPMAAAGAKSGDIHGVRRDTGELVWTRSLCPQTDYEGTTGIFVNSSWSGQSVLAACNKRTVATLSALDPATGEILWNADLGGLVMGRISSANGVGFVGAGSNMVVFDVASGDVIQRIAAANGTSTVTGTVSIVDGRVAYGEGMGWASARPGTTLTVLSLP